MKLPHPHSRHWNFHLALAGGLIVLAACAWPLRQLSAVLGATAFALIYLLLTLRDMPRLTPDYLRRHARDEDAPPLLVFLLTIAIVVYVMVALFMVINAGSKVEPLRLGLGALSVVAAWLMINLMWAMHYAWEFYQAPENVGKAQQRGGLDFCNATIQMATSGYYRD